MTTPNEPKPFKYPVATAPTPTKYKLQSPRGAALATRFWSSSSSSSKLPQALVLIVHGAGWHSGYFEGLASCLVKNCHAAVGCYDQVGCGYSDKEPGTPSSGGKVGVQYIHSFDDFVEDLFEAVKWLKLEAAAVTATPNSDDGKYFEGLPLFLIGESFGGLQVSMAVVKRSFLCIVEHGCCKAAQRAIWTCSSWSSSSWPPLSIRRLSRRHFKHPTTMCPLQA